MQNCREQSFAIRAYAMSAVGIDVVSVHNLFDYTVASTVSTDIVSSHYEILQNRIRYHKIAECIARYKRMNCLRFYGVSIVVQPRNGMKPAPLIFA